MLKQIKFEFRKQKQPINVVYPKIIGIFPNKIKVVTLQNPK
jgi:hypothetical protein